MKTVFSSRRHHYVAKASIFLITVALIAGMVGCGGGGDGDGGGEYYTLTIASTAGGSVTTPGGIATYDEGTVVNLVATPHACCHFVNWTGDVGTIADVNDATTTITVNGDYAITANFEGEAVTFADPNLEAAVRGVIAIPQGPIYTSDLDRLYSLSASEKNIADLTGLECATSLIVLEVQSNQISDISPLANLTSLTGLYLEYNQIGDISPLANLTTLTVLDLGDNQISDISPLANLTSLTGLSLDHNQIGDISPLANLTHLENLHLYDNQISDISPLANLTNLEYLYLWNNQISDISPLVDNEGLSEGDQVDLTLNPLSSDSINVYIPQLEARGVTVIY
ncbi:MAG: leucine-rich repeat domain-containing protein [Dehalococcoidia bacterium]|nr:leucine-rich repeat domain-containing protein [Dehalococcoidia bacterium]